MHVCEVVSVMSDSVTLWRIALQVPMSAEFSKWEYWSGLPCPPPGDLPNPGIEPVSLSLLHWQGDSLPLAPPGNPVRTFHQDGMPFHILMEFSVGPEFSLHYKYCVCVSVCDCACVSVRVCVCVWMWVCEHVWVCVCVCVRECVWVCVCIYVLVAQSHLILCNPMDRGSPQASLSMRFSRQEYRSGLPFPSSGDLPDPGITPGSPAFQAYPLPSEPPGPSTEDIFIPAVSRCYLFGFLSVAILSGIFFSFYGHSLVIATL